MGHKAGTRHNRTSKPLLRPDEAGKLDPEFYEDDLIHPSVAGSAVIGTHIAAVVNGG